jgi:hypothetical protein
LSQSNEYQANAYSLVPLWYGFSTNFQCSDLFQFRIADDESPFCQLLCAVLLPKLLWCSLTGA